MAMIVAARNVTPDSWSGLRLALYALMAAAASAAAVFGFAMPPGWMEQAGTLLDAIGMAVLAVAAYKVPTAYTPEHADAGDDA